VPHKLKEPTALNFFEIRRAKILPPYFESISIPYTYNLEESLNKWIVQHLKGRYYVGKSVDVVASKDGQSTTVDTVMKVGFEEGKELAYFMLACPLLKYK
jgi:hypothetical protein